MTEEEAYELFRRAIVERNADAWAEIHARYRPLLMSWAARLSARSQIGEWYEDIADQALVRAWLALTPEGFAQFSSLARLLAYLRNCVASTVIDGIRAQASRERVLHTLEINSPAPPEQVVLANIDRDALWQAVSAVVATPAERIMLIESFVYDLPPRAICSRYPEFFPDVTVVYTTKRNLLNRLRRNSDLQQLRESFVSQNVCS